MRHIETGRVPAEADPVAGTIEGTGWGLFFIWVGLCILAGLGWSVFVLGAGVLLLAGQAARWHFGLRVDRFAVLLGACFGVAGLGHLLELRWLWAVAPAWLLPALLMAFGGGLMVLAWRRALRR